MPLITAHCIALSRLLAHTCMAHRTALLPFNCITLLYGHYLAITTAVLMSGMASDHVNSKSIQHTEESWSSQPDSTDVMQAIEEQGLRQSYGSDPSRSHRIDGASVSSIEHDSAAFGSVPRRLSTIVSGVSASGTPSAAEMHSLQSQVQHLP